MTVAPRFLAILGLTFASASPALAEVAKVPDCPAAVKTAIEKAFAKSSITRCKAEKEHGHDQFEVKLTKSDGKMAEVDVSPEGKILQVEEKIEVSKLPAAVTKAFAAKYPKAKVDSAEKQTPAEGKVTYELAFAGDKGRKEVTFDEDGKLIEEE
jgi:hypothetical protein